MVIDQDLKVNIYNDEEIIKILGNLVHDTMIVRDSKVIFFDFNDNSMAFDPNSEYKEICEFFLKINLHTIRQISLRYGSGSVVNIYRGEPKDQWVITHR